MRNWEERFDLLWGIAPTDSLKGKRAIELKAFIHTLLNELADEVEGSTWTHEGTVGAAPVHRKIHNDALREAAQIIRSTTTK